MNQFREISSSSSCIASVPTSHSNGADVGQFSSSSSITNPPTSHATTNGPSKLSRSKHQITANTVYREFYIGSPPRLSGQRELRISDNTLEQSDDISQTIPHQTEPSKSDITSGERLPEVSLKSHEIHANSSSNVFRKGFKPFFFRSGVERSKFKGPEVKLKRPKSATERTKNVVLSPKSVARSSSPQSWLLTPGIVIPEQLTSDDAIKEHSIVTGSDVSGGSRQLSGLQAIIRSKAKRSCGSPCSTDGTTNEPTTMAVASKQEEPPKVTDQHSVPLTANTTADWSALPGDIATQRSNSARVDDEHQTNLAEYSLKMLEKYHSPLDRNDVTRHSCPLLNNKQRNVTYNWSKQVTEVTLTNSAGGSTKLGFTVVGGQDSPRGPMGIYVRTISDGGLVSANGQIAEGDEIVQVNDERFENLTHREAVSLLKKCRKEPTIRLYIRRMKVKIETNSKTRLMSGSSSKRLDSSNEFNENADLLQKTVFDNLQQPLDTVSEMENTFNWSSDAVRNGVFSPEILPGTLAFSQDVNTRPIIDGAEMRNGSEVLLAMPLPSYDINNNTNGAEDALSSVKVTTDCEEHLANNCVVAANDLSSDDEACRHGDRNDDASPRDDVHINRSSDERVPVMLATSGANLESEVVDIQGDFGLLDGSSEAKVIGSQSNTETSDDEESATVQTSDKLNIAFLAENTEAEVITNRISRAVCDEELDAEVAEKQTNLHSFDNSSVVSPYICNKQSEELGIVNQVNLGHRNGTCEIGVANSQACIDLPAEESGDEEISSQNTERYAKSSGVSVATSRMKPSIPDESAKADVVNSQSDDDLSNEESVPEENSSELNRGFLALAELETSCKQTNLPISPVEADALELSTQPNVVISDDNFYSDVVRHHSNMSTQTLEISGSHRLNTCPQDEDVLDSAGKGEHEIILQETDEQTASISELNQCEDVNVISGVTGHLLEVESLPQSMEATECQTGANNGKDCDAILVELLLFTIAEDGKKMEDRMDDMEHDSEDMPDGTRYFKDDGESKSDSNKQSLRKKNANEILKLAPQDNRVPVAETLQVLRNSSSAELNFTGEFRPVISEQIKSQKVSEKKYSMVDNVQVLSHNSSCSASNAAVEFSDYNFTPQETTATANCEFDPNLRSANKVAIGANMSQETFPYSYVEHKVQHNQEAIASNETVQMNPHDNSLETERLSYNGHCDVRAANNKHVVSSIPTADAARTQLQTPLENVEKQRAKEKLKFALPRLMAKDTTSRIQVAKSQTSAEYCASPSPDENVGLQHSGINPVTPTPGVTNSETTQQSPVFEENVSNSYSTNVLSVNVKGDTVTTKKSITFTEDTSYGDEKREGTERFSFDPMSAENYVDARSSYDKQNTTSTYCSRLTIGRPRRRRVLLNSSDFKSHDVIINKEGGDDDMLLSPVSNSAPYSVTLRVRPSEYEKDGTANESSDPTSSSVDDSGSISLVKIELLSSKNHQPTVSWEQPVVDKLPPQASALSRRSPSPTKLRLCSADFSKTSRRSLSSSHDYRRSVDISGRPAVATVYARPAHVRQRSAENSTKSRRFLSSSQDDKWTAKPSVMPVIKHRMDQWIERQYLRRRPITPTNRNLLYHSVLSATEQQ